MPKQHSQSNEAPIHIAHNLHKLPSCVFLQITSENVWTLTHFMKKYSSYIFYWIKVEVFFKRNSFVRKMRHCFVILSSCLCHAILSHTQFSPKLLSIFEQNNLNYWWNKFGLNYRQCRLFLGLGKNLDNPLQFPTH